jgi:hypothetical protein
MFFSASAGLTITGCPSISWPARRQQQQNSSTEIKHHSRSLYMAHDHASAMQEVDLLMTFRNRLVSLGQSCSHPDAHGQALAQHAADECMLCKHTQLFLRLLSRYAGVGALAGALEGTNPHNNHAAMTQHRCLPIASAASYL